MRTAAPSSLPVRALPGAADRVLALDEPGLLQAGQVRVNVSSPGGMSPPVKVSSTRSR
jgi:hypothetical protein